VERMQHGKAESVKQNDCELERNRLIREQVDQLKTISEKLDEIKKNTSTR